ncbi:hypothetical protein [Spiroplasma floricola]|uniref:MFS transporter n=1 Tax=Spiroplasma floricola 23-6 TaxID=1336749 RepID=A0A2K8SD10_9MOLU|nr:hypothetical protein [Spiroplasma floricola]AUB31205.1 hypothetical protein SFLOR_v1c01440 [Spiroplasma floricola 23-6]
MENKKNIIFDMTISAMLLSVGICLKLTFLALPGFDLTLIIILITGLFFKSNISIISTAGISALSFLISKDIILWASTITVYLLLNIFLIIMRKIILKNNAIAYIILPIFGLMITTFYLIISILVYGKINGYSMYLVHLHEAYIIFFMYCILTPTIFKKIFQVMTHLNYKYSTIFNKSFKKYIETIEDSTYKVSDKKINYNVQLVSMIFSMMLLICYFSFVPYKMVTVLNNINYLATIIIVPLLMLFVTPLWMKSAKKIGNLNMLKINSVGLLLAIIFTFSSFTSQKYNITLAFSITGLVLFGVFIAGFLPINIETIKSYEYRNKLKNKTSKYNSIFGFLLLPLPFLINYYLGSIYVLIFFMLISILILFLLMLNKNIMLDGNVLNIDRNSFSTLKKKKVFFLEVLVQNYFIGFFKFLDLSLVLFYFIIFDNNKIFIEWNNKNGIVLIFLVLGFLSKYIAQAIFANIKYNNKNINKIAMLVTIVSVLTFIGFLVLNYFLVTKNVNYYYYSLLTILMFIFGASYSIIEKTKAKTFRSIVSENEFSLAMIIDHVAGNAFFSLIITAIFFTTMLLIKNSLIGLIILLTLFMIIALIMMSIKITLNKRQKNKTISL